MPTTNIDPTAVEAVEAAVNKIAAMPAALRWEFLVALLPKLLTAVLLLVVGIVLVKLVRKGARRLLARSKLDPTLHNFIVSILSVSLYILLGVVVLNVLIPTAVTSLVAVVGMFGLAVSLAVKDSLANLAGGFSVLFTKPFAMGDYVKIGGNEGTICEIRLNYTVMKTFDNKVVHIPNGDVAKAQIANFTCESTRRLDLVFSVGYHDDFERAQAIVRELLAENPMALSEPAPIVRMVEHGASALKLGCKVWCATDDYWSLNYDLLEEVKRRFDAAGIGIPYNQLDVRVLGE